MFCAGCGNKLTSANNIFCGNCGKQVDRQGPPLDTPSQATAQQTGRRSKKKAAIVAIAAAAIVVAVVIFAVNGGIGGIAGGGSSTGSSASEPDRGDSGGLDSRRETSDNNSLGSGQGHRSGLDGRWEFREDGEVVIIEFSGNRFAIYDYWMGSEELFMEGTFSLAENADGQDTIEFTDSRTSFVETLIIIERSRNSITLDDWGEDLTFTRVGNASIGHGDSRFGEPGGSGLDGLWENADDMILMQFSGNRFTVTYTDTWEEERGTFSVSGDQIEMVFENENSRVEVLLFSRTENTFTITGDWGLTQTYTRIQ